MTQTCIFCIAKISLKMFLNLTTHVQDEKTECSAFYMVTPLDNFRVQNI